MDVGSVVKATCDVTGSSLIGVIVEVIYPKAKNPDYRTPTSMRVFCPDKGILWFYKDELRVINGSG